jgi:hypothetical protein
VHFVLYLTECWKAQYKRITCSHTFKRVKYKMAKFCSRIAFTWVPPYEGVLGEWRYTLRILDLGDRWRWVVSFTFRPLYPRGKSPWYPFDRKLGGLQSRSERGVEEKNSQPPPGFKPYHRIVQPLVSRYTDWAILVVSRIATLYSSPQCMINTHPIFIRSFQTYAGTQCDF